MPDSGWIVRLQLPAWILKMIEAFLVCTGVVALAEMGDKTQLLSIVLAARYRRPWPIIAAILVATLLNHALAGWAGVWVGNQMPHGVLRWILGLSFLAMAAWLLVPDKLDDDIDRSASSRGTIFFTTLWLFFIAEIGDKTQVATVGLAIRYSSLVAVVAGTTAGMMLANVPAVLLGERFANRIPAVWLRGTAALVFAVIGLLTLAGVGSA